MIKEHEQQTAFLKDLVFAANPPEAAKLLDRLRKAQCDAKCSRRAVGIVFLTAALALAGIGYGSILQPQFFYRSTVLAQSFSVLLVASLISLVVFLIIWLGFMARCNNVRRECRNLGTAIDANTAHASGFGQFPAGGNRHRLARTLSCRRDLNGGNGVTPGRLAKQFNLLRYRAAALRLVCGEFAAVIDGCRAQEEGGAPKELTPAPISENPLT